jgi:hypothetical protein
MLDKTLGFLNLSREGKKIRLGIVKLLQKYRELRRQGHRRGLRLFSGRGSSVVSAQESRNQ